jgi:putative DNA primase/helicase
MSLERVLEGLRLAGKQVGKRSSSGEHSCQCPVCNSPKNKHLSVRETANGAVLIRCHHEPSCNPKAVMESIGLSLADLAGPGNGQHKGGPNIVATYDYTDEKGELLYQTVRFDPKDFRQRRPDGVGGWAWNLGHTRRVPYHLPLALAAITAGLTIFVVEGEKDVQRLENAGLVATTNALGAGKWSEELAQALAGAHLVIIPDNDTPGRTHAAQVAALCEGKAASIKVLMLEGIPEKGDVSDWLGKHNAEELAKLAEQAAPWSDGQLLELETASYSTWEDTAELLGPIEWDWPGWLPRGFVTMVASASGVGKSLLALRLADCYLRFQEWPDGTPVEGDLGGAVLWLEGEAAQAMNLQRANAWGLPISGILNPFKDPFEAVLLADPEKRAAIKAVAARDEVRLIVVDSLSGVNGGDENAARMLEMVRFLAELARDTNKALLLLHHLRKRSERDDPQWGVTLDMVRGHGSIVQLTRVVWALDLPGGPGSEVRRLQQIKNNMEPFGEPIGMAVQPEGVIFCDPPDEPAAISKMAEAKGFLWQVLANGPVAVHEIERLAQETHISTRTLNRAKSLVKVSSVYKDRVSHWALAAPDEPWWTGKDE